MSDREEVDRLTVKCDGLRKLVDRLFNRWRWLKEETGIQLSTLRAENERLRERCEAAEKAVAFFFECQIAIQLPGGNADETFGFETLRDGRFAVTKWVDARQFFHIRDTPMEAFQDAITAGWLPDSNNKGGE